MTAPVSSARHPASCSARQAAGTKSAVVQFPSVPTSTAGAATITESPLDEPDPEQEEVLVKEVEPAVPGKSEAVLSTTSNNSRQDGKAKSKKKGKKGSN